MTEQRCIWRGSDQPRALVGRHVDECGDEACRGCLPCPDAHCVVCGITHSLGACAACVGAVREDLDDIRRLCDDLPAEVEVKGVTGEAFNLLGPAADPEAIGHMQASVATGRIPAEWLETADDAHHPLFVAASWASVYREAFDHDEPSSRVELSDELGYLDRNLAYMANHEHVPFGDFAKDVRGCVGHLQSVLHDSNRGERTNINCLDCGGILERRLGPKGFDDIVTCQGCGRRYKPAEYNFAVWDMRIRKSDWLTAEDMFHRTQVVAATVRSWARNPKDGSDPLIRKQTQDGRTVYCVADVLHERDTRNAGAA